MFKFSFIPCPGGCAAGIHLMNMSLSKEKWETSRRFAHLQRHPNSPQVQGSRCFEVSNLHRAQRLLLPYENHRKKNRRGELLCESIFLVPLTVFQVNAGIQAANRWDEQPIRRCLVPVHAEPGRVQRHLHRTWRCKENRQEIHLNRIICFIFFSSGPPPRNNQQKRVRFRPLLSQMSCKWASLCSVVGF